MNSEFRFSYRGEVKTVFARSYYRALKIIIKAFPDIRKESIINVNLTKINPVAVSD